MSLTFPITTSSDQATDSDRSRRRGARRGGRRSARSLRLRIDFCLADLDVQSQSEVSGTVSMQAGSPTSATTDRSPANWSERVPA